MSELHPAAAHGYGNAADVYQSGRPDYPRELLPWLRHRLRLAPGKLAVDLGAGTGKFTRLLRETGAHVLAVEPVPAMRAVLASTLPELHIMAGTAEAIPVEDASVDAVLCAQSFHWFASSAALAEIHRALRPGAMLGLVWNVRDESVGWVGALSALLARYEGDAPRFHTGAWRRAFEGNLFSDLIVTRLTHHHVGAPREVIINRFMSVSFIAALSSDERTRVAQELARLTATHPDLAGREVVDMPYVTEAYYCTRR